MSLLGAMNTAISGLTAQSNAFGNISDNVANSQTVGFKRIDTNFVDYLTSSTAASNTPGVVIARPDYVNDVQGTIQQQQNPLALAVAGAGFFAVSQPVGVTAGTPSFRPEQFYTRAGDFSMDVNGYLVNSAGSYLNGWAADPTTGTLNRARWCPSRSIKASTIRSPPARSRSPPIFPQRPPPAPSCPRNCRSMTRWAPCTPSPWIGHKRRRITGPSASIPPTTPRRRRAARPTFSSAPSPPEIRFPMARSATSMV
jgi:hypothetical protein